MLKKQKVKKTISFILVISIMISSSLGVNAAISVRDPQNHENTSLYPYSKNSKLSNELETYSGTCGENLTWNLDATTGVLTISGIGDMTNYEDNSFSWYEQSSSIKSVKIGTGVTSIGNHAFDWCINLVSIDIPDSVTYIGVESFSFCESLTSINIPNNVKSIGDRAFYGCKNLKSIYIPASLTNIGAQSFVGCDNLTKIKVDTNNT
ncbi:MAG: leucine-rich repeat domain-containing protein, partial [Oscillospiraceae bacterium]|nr:leucine-rich repeat domain-containing protein [Oscillospiraceae bacterium]